MVRKFHSKQPDLFIEQQRAQAGSYFDRDWPAECKPLNQYRLDVLTPWYQGRLNHLSPLEKMATIAILRMNADKPISSPFTLDDACSSSDVAWMVGKRTRDELRPHKTFKVVGGTTTEPPPRTRSDISGLLSKLEKIGVIRRSTAEEAECHGTQDKRTNVYVFNDPRVEEWFRQRNARTLAGVQLVSVPA